MGCVYFVTSLTPPTGRNTIGLALGQNTHCGLFIVRNFPPRRCATTHHKGNECVLSSFPAGEPQLGICAQHQLYGDLVPPASGLAKDARRRSGRSWPRLSVTTS